MDGRGRAQLGCLRLCDACQSLHNCSAGAGVGLRLKGLPPAVLLLYWGEMIGGGKDGVETERKWRGTRQMLAVQLT